MSLPDKISINGRDIPILEFMLCPCQTKEDLRLWIDMFLGINFPDTTIAEGSNSSPMDMIWWTYQKCVLDRESKVGSRALFVASRASYKTLGASVIELLVIIHGNRDVAHIGAIEVQAKRCYSYFTKYMMQDAFRQLLLSDPTMQKSIFKSGRSIECLPCTVAAVNSPHTSFVCIGGSSQILLDNTNKSIKNNNRQKIIMSAAKLYKLIKGGQKINAISYNHETQQIESQPITDAYDNGKRERLKIITDAKYPLWCTPDHKLFDPKSQEYKPAKDFKIGDQLVTLLKAPLDSKPKRYYDINSRTIALPAYSKEEEFEQVMLGPMLGDGGVYRKEHSNAYYSENHGLGVVHQCKDCGSHEFRVNTNNSATLCSKCYNQKQLPIKTYTIKDIIFLKTRRTVYDFTVANNHNFFASGILTHNCLDEVDTVKDMQAYRDISGIPSVTVDGRPPVQIAISTRKGIFGLVQQEIDAAHLTGMQIFSWNIIDITKRCLDERSGTERIPIYVNFDSLEAISEAEWKLRPVTEQKKFQYREGFDGCLSRCKCFAACLGNLKNQTSDSPLLHEIDYAQEKILSVPVDWANAQLLCRKPSTEGTIYPTFVYVDHVKTYSEMYEIFTGEKPARQLDFDMLRHEFEKRGMLPYMAVDFGEHLAAALLFYVDGKGYVYVVKEQNFTGTDDHELALWLKQNWGGYGVQLVFPDVANPSGIRLLIKQGFPCSKKVNKDVNAGISTVRSFLRIPGTNRPLIAIHEDCKGLIWELPRYHRKKMPNEQFSEDPEGINDHNSDALRYFLHTVFGVQSGMVSSSDTSMLRKPIKTQEGDFVKVPSAQELAQHLGRNDFVDNSDLFNDDGSEKKGGGNEGPAGGGFQFSW